jgi:hypothetical protein
MTRVGVARKPAWLRGSEVPGMPLKHEWCCPRCCPWESPPWKTCDSSGAANVRDGMRFGARCEYRSTLSRRNRPRPGGGRKSVIARALLAGRVGVAVLARRALLGSSEPTRVL